jgi:hypothetical protein
VRNVSKEAGRARHRGEQFFGLFGLEINFAFFDILSSLNVNEEEKKQLIFYETSI